MQSILFTTTLALPFASSALIPRANDLLSAIRPRQADKGPLTFTDMTKIPDKAKAPNTFNNGQESYPGMPPQDDFDFPEMYKARPIDLPFGQLFHGKINFYKKGEMNTEDDVMDKGKPGVNDDAEQTACGVPDNAFGNSKVAVHPYFLKYAGLDRYCQQDVCVSFWTDGHSDMIAKVLDICDPEECKSPEDIKLPRSKVAVARHKTSGWTTDPQFAGDQDTESIWWFFTKCIADGNAQAAYVKPADNWFTSPRYPNKNSTAIPESLKQQQNNQESYPAKGWQTYTNGLYPQAKDYESKHSPIKDWVPGTEPAWSPVAGGKGHAKSTGGGTKSVQGGGTTGETGGEGNSTTKGSGKESGNGGEGNTDTTGSDPVGSDTKGSDTKGSDTKGSDTVGNGAGQKPTPSPSASAGPSKETGSEPEKTESDGGESSTGGESTTPKQVTTTPTEEEGGDDSEECEL